MMHSNLAATAVVILLAWPTASTLQAAPTELASIAVSLTVQETCLVQSADALISAANQPVVSCLHGAPYRIAQAGLDPATPAGAVPDASRPVRFAAAGNARQTVWTVNF